MPLAPLLKRLTDIAIILGVIGVISLLFIMGGNSMAAKTTLAKSYGMWLAFITRPDIIVTSILAVIVTMALGHYNSTRKR